MMRRILITGFILAIAAIAEAQPAADAADGYFRQGNTFYKEQRWVEARDAFENAWRLKKAHDIAANLAYAEMKLGKWRDAAEHLAFAVRTWPPTGKSDKRQYATERFGVVKREVGTLRIEVNVARADVLIDGRLAGVAPLEGEAFVEPGTHTVEARLAGYAPACRTVDVAKGGGAEVALVLRETAPPPSAPRATATAAPSPPPKHSPVPGAVLGAVGGAAVVTGIVFVAVASGRLSSTKNLSGSISAAHASCVAGAANFNARCAELESMSSSSDTFGRTGTGLLIGGGLAAAGALVYFLWPSSSPATTVTPSASAQGGGVLVSGRF